MPKAKVGGLYAFSVPIKNPGKTHFFFVHEAISYLSIIEPELYTLEQKVNFHYGTYENNSSIYYSPICLVSAVLVCVKRANKVSGFCAGTAKRSKLF